MHSCCDSSYTGEYGKEKSSENTQDLKAGQLNKREDCMK